MPNYVENQRFVPSALRMTDGRTAPPGPLSEADLISTMDRNGIGTDATIATHIKTIQDRSYVTRQGNSFKPTNLGRAIIEGYKDMDLGALWKPTLRAKMESDMKLVGQGRMTKAAALAANIEMYRAAFIVARSKGYVLDQSVSKYFPRDPDAFVQFEIGRPCDGCARPLLVRKTKEGKYLIACPGKPVCQARPLWLSQCAKKISAAPVAANDNAVCPTCGAHKVHIQVDEARVPPRWPFMSTEVDCCLYCNRDARACLVG
jgi:DNA topoisomerase-3